MVLSPPPPTHTHTCTHTRSLAHTRTQAHRHTNIHTQTHTHACTLTHTHTHPPRLLAGMLLERLNGPDVEVVLQKPGFCDIHYIRDMLFQVGEVIGFRVL